MITFNCDICGIETFINPPVEQAYREMEQEYTVPDPENPGTLKTEKRTIKIPEMTVMRTQDPHNPNRTIEQKIPKLLDLKPRMWRVQLRIGQECIDRDFCKDCLDKNLRGELAHLRDVLEAIERK